MRLRIIKGVGMMLALCMCLSGCAKGGSAQPNARQLLSNDYEAEYIFLAAGLPIDDETPMTDPDGVRYGVVESEKMTTLKQLRDMLEQTYADKAVIDAFMATTDMDGNPLYVDIEGKLCRSYSPQFAALTASYDPESVSAVKKGTDDKKRATMTYAVTEQREDGAVYSAEILITEVKSGQWRLNTRRADAPRTLMQGGTAAPESTTAIVDIANGFAAALAAGDTAALEQLGGAQPGSYSTLAQAGVTSCTVTETITEQEQYGEYKVSLTVAQGNKTFPEGTTSYRMMVGEDQLGGTGRVVQQFYPENDPPYLTLLPDKQTVNAINQVYRLMMLQGEAQFNSVSELKPEVITEYALYELSLGDPENVNGFSGEELQGMIKKMFGLDGFTPANQFYSEESKSYLFYGRGGAPFNARLTLLMEGNGLAEVEAQYYSDALQLSPTQRVVYTLKNNWNNTYQFVSAKASE